MTPQSRARLDHFTVRQLLEMEACTRCGECIAWCPTYTAARSLSESQAEAAPASTQGQGLGAPPAVSRTSGGFEEITPLSKISRFRAFWKGQHGGWLARLFGLRPPEESDVAAFGQGTYQCTLCGRCAVVCPVHIRTRDLWISLREQLVDWHAYPQVFDTLRERVGSVHNISGDDNHQRLIWAENLEEWPAMVVPGQPVETIYFVGCVASFYPTVYTVPQDFVTVLRRVGADFAVLGGEEWCCGFPLVIAGMGEAARTLAAHNVQLVREAGARRLVTTCPSCYHTWCHTYPELLGEALGFEVFHATEWLAAQVRGSKLPLRPLEMKVTYHDPCDLGRTSGLYEPPREVLRAIPGLELVEMAENREHALCCGGGGDVEMGSPELTEGVAHLRLEQARATGAEVIATACQQCKRTLAAQARKERVRLRVVDVAELVRKALEG